MQVNTSKYTINTWSIKSPQHFCKHNLQQWATEKTQRKILSDSFPYFLHTV